LPHKSATEAIGQGCRLLSNYEQQGIPGVLEVCPDHRVRVWAFTPEPLPVKSALKSVQSAKKRAFISTGGGTYPLTEDDVCVEIPPYRDPETRRWSVVMTLQQAERLLEGASLSRIETDWSQLCDMGQDQEERLLGFLEETYTEGWENDLPTHSTSKGQAPPNGNARKSNPAPQADESDSGEGFTCAEEVMDGLQRKIAPSEGKAGTGGGGKDSFREASLTPLSESVPTVIGRLLDPTLLSIPTPSPVLNRMLNGGWGLGQFHLLVGASGSGKTTFCSWIADYTAGQKIPVVFVSYQLQREEMAIYALSRNARIDSSKIESRVWLDPETVSESDLTKRLIDAGRHYFQTGDFFHFLEGGESTSLWEIESSVRRVRERAGIEDSDPVLVIVDSLRELDQAYIATAEANGLSAQNRSLAVNLRQLARQTNSTLLLTAGLSQPLNLGGTGLAETILGDSEICPFAPLAASVLLLDSSRVRKAAHTSQAKSVFGEEDRIYDPLDRIVEDGHYDPKIAKNMDRIRSEYPLSPEVAATFSRVTALRNRGGRTRVSAIFRYERALHNFQAIHPDAPTAVDHPEKEEAHAGS
jgi:KaiC/GvpD/RAD55 family RecA-like ATPase